MDNLSPSTEAAETGELNATDLMRDYLDDKLSLDPIAEPESENQDRYCDVATAARVLGKSTRQIQRLLKEGKLVGHKTFGRTGPEWKIDCRELPFQKPDSHNLDSLTERIAAMESKIELVANGMQGLKLRIEIFDSQIERLMKAESITELVSKELFQLKDQIEETRKIMQETAAKVAQQECPSATAKNVEQLKLVENVTDKQIRPSWWQRVLA